MPPVTLEGINTGLPPNLIKKIMEAERKPLKNLENRKSKSKTRLDLVENLDKNLGKIKSSAEKLISRGGFRDLKLESSDSNVVDGVVDEGVDAKGSVTLEVLKLPRKASVVTNSFSDKDKTEVGVGYFRFRTNKGNRTLFIDGNNNTLEKIMKKINSERIGLKATILTDKSDLKYPFRLMISGLKSGLENKVEYPNLYFLDGDQDFFFETDRQASNGRVKVEDFEMEIGDNDLKDILPGVTLTLKQAVPGKIVHIEVKEDAEQILTKFKAFIDSINGVLEFIQKQNQLDESTDTSSTLGGDSLLQSIEFRFRRLIQNRQLGIKGEVKFFSELGVSFNRSGLLDFDANKFQSVMKKSSFSVEQFLYGDGVSVGFIPGLNRELASMTDQVFGPIEVRKKALKDKIERINERVANKEKQLIRREEELRRKFANLESTMARLKSQSALLNSLGGGGGVSGLLNFSGAQVGSET